MGIHNKLPSLLQSPYAILDPGDAGTIKVDRDLGIVDLESTGVETRTLDAPLRAGLRLVIRMKTDGGNITLTAPAGLNVALDTQAVYANVGDLLSLVSVTASSGYRWEILVNTAITALPSTSPSATPSASPSASVSATPSASVSASPSASPSASVSASPSASVSASVSASPSQSPSSSES